MGNIGSLKQAWPEQCRGNWVKDVRLGILDSQKKTGETVLGDSIELRILFSSGMLLGGSSHLVSGL